MTPAYAYGVVILPPPDLTRKLLLLRRQHPLLQAQAPPHITVKSPFYFRFTGATVVEQLETICERFVPFEIEIRGTGTFQHRVIYARVEGDPELYDLHQALVDGLTGYVESISERWDGEGFRPHLTLADKLAPTDLEPARKLLSDFRPFARFLVDRIHLLRGRGRWDIVRTFSLGPA
jgi:2'-5' RNA ligase